ncbi:cupin domain-containing protein [Arthrobacter sp. NyZ413]|uniref:cupin domain-containing protein n=1 Tax=Arthrobacter sp. NyZ413 TaxID=3144669 RepID=UPI003BF832EB
MSVSILTPYLAGATDAVLEDWGPLEEATGHEMQTAGVSLWRDGDASAGVWECTAGPSRWVLAAHEVIAIVAGRMTVTQDGGEPIEMSAGDVAIFPKGWSGAWEVHETIRKVYAIF